MSSEAGKGDGYRRVVISKFNNNHDAIKKRFPICPRCGNNRQVWKNQISGKMTCHRLGCQIERE